MDKKTALAVLLWCIRLTYCGMPLSYARYLMLKKQEEIESCGADDSLAKKFL